MEATERITGLGNDLLRHATTLGGALAGIGAVAVAVGALALDARSTTLGITTATSWVATTRAGYYFFPDSLKSALAVAIGTLAGQRLLIALAVTVVALRRVPPRWHPHVAQWACLGAIVIGAANVVWETGGFDSVNRNVLGVPTESAQSGRTTLPPPWVREFHRRLLAQENRADIVERTYGWSVIAILASAAVYASVRGIKNVRQRQALLANLLVVSLLQAALLPRLYGTFMLTGEPPCITVLAAMDAKAPQAPVKDDEAGEDKRPRGFLLSDLMVDEMVVQLLARNASRAASVLWVKRDMLSGFEFGGGCGRWLPAPRSWQ